MPAKVYVCNLTSVSLMLLMHSFSMGSFIVLKWKDESRVQQSMRILESVCNSWKDIAELIGLDSSRNKAIETVRQLDPKECCRDVFDDLRSSQPLQT